MSKSKFRSFGLLLLTGSTLVLTSCGSTTTKHFPNNKDDNIVNGIVGGDDIAYNDFETFYESISGGTTIEAKVLQDLLYKIAEKEVDISDELLTEKIEETLLAEVSGGAYDTDYKFDEMRYVLSLRSNMYNIVCGDKNANAKKGIVITPDMKYSEVFGCDYSDYINRVVKPNTLRKFLVAKYIYDESYSSIGNTYSRKVNIVKITDRSDAKGSAIKVISAFIDDYIANKDATEEQRQLDNLARIWIGDKDKLTADDKAFYQKHGLENLNLNAQIDEEVAKIKLDDEVNTDKSLESKYTNSYTYSVEKGEELARDSLARTDLMTDGYHLKSSGLSDLPTAVKNRVFSTNYTLNPDMSAESKDVTTFINGHRYLTPAKVENRNDLLDLIVHYDASTDSYFIIEILDVITTAALEKLDSDTEEQASAKKERAMEVAYILAETSTYVTDSTVHWLKNSNISYSDQDFYDYILSSYPDVFEEDDE